MKRIFVIFILFKTVYCNAQYSSTDIISEFNEMGKSYYGFKSGITLPLPSSGLPPYLNTYYGNLFDQTLMEKGTDGMSYALESLIIMYKTTKDKAYLYEFIRHALELQHWRGNYNEVCNSEIKNNTI